jgi:hypothetical protein
MTVDVTVTPRRSVDHKIASVDLPSDRFVSHAWSK